MNRTVLIGIDGATFTVLDQLFATGVMPQLEALVARGVRATLTSTAHPLTPPAWTSMITGRTPGNHGIFDFIRASEGDGGLYFTLNASHDLRCETLWSMVSRQGGRASALNFPVSSPPQPINGHVVPGFVPWRHLRRAVHPRELYNDIKAIPGFDAKRLSMDMNEELKAIQWLPDDEYESWIEAHIERERQWFRIAKHLLEKDPTEMFAVMFDGVDKLQHLCWEHLDPELFTADASPQKAQVREWCLGYFRELDSFIGEIVRLAGPEARIYLASDHGFGPSTDIFYANVWLESEGYLKWNTDGEKSSPDGMVSGDTIKSHVVGIDWDRTVAYALTPSSNGIFLRTDNGGRERYEALRDEIRKKLLNLEHPRNGGPLLRAVMTREEAFPGAACEEAPDLTLQLHDYGFLSVLNADVTVWKRPVPFGTHHPDGIFLAAGPGIRSGETLERLSIVDVAPTLLHSLGLPVPADLEGRVPSSVYEPDFLGAQPVVAGPPTHSPSDEPESVQDEKMSEDDEALIMQRLRALGYIE